MASPSLDPTQKARYLDFFSDSADTGFSDRNYIYLPTETPLPALEFLREYEKRLKRQFGEDFVREIQLTGSAVHWILNERRPNLANLNLTVQIRQPQNWASVDAVFKETVQSFSKRLLPDRWRTVHLTLQNELQSAQLDELPALRTGKYQPLTIQTVALNALASFTSVDALSLSLRPAMQLPQSCQKLAKIPISSKPEYRTETCLDELQRGCSSSIRESIPHLFQGARGYCHTLSYTGCFPSDPAIDQAFGSSILPLERADLERYLNIHYSDDTSGKLLFLLNYHALIKRSIKDKQLRNVHIESVFGLICKFLKSTPKAYTPEQMHAFFRYAICYLYLLSKKDKPVENPEETLYKIPIDHSFLFARIDRQTWREFQAPSEPLLSHDLLNKFTQIFPHRALNLQQFFEMHFPPNQLHEEIPSFEQASLQELLVWTRRDLNGHTGALQQRARELWKTSPWSEELSSLLPHIPEVEGLMQQALHAQDWKKMIALCQFNPNLKPLVYAATREKNIPLKYLLSLFNDPEKLDDLSRLPDQKGVKDWLLKQPVAFAQNYVLHRPVWAFELFERFKEELVTEQNALVLAENLPPRHLNGLYTASERLFPQNPALFVCLFEKLYPKKLFKPEQLDALLMEYKERVVQHVARHAPELVKNPEMKAWFQCEAEKLERPSAIVLQTLKSLAPRPAQLKPSAPQPDNLRDRGMEIIAELKTEDIESLHSAIARIDIYLLPRPDQAPEILDKLIKFCKNKKLPLLHRKELYLYCLHLAGKYEDLRPRFIPIFESATATNTLNAIDTLQPNRYSDEIPPPPYTAMIAEHNPQFRALAQVLIAHQNSQPLPAPSSEEKTFDYLIINLKNPSTSEQALKKTLDELCKIALSHKNSGRAERLIDCVEHLLEVPSLKPFEKLLLLAHLKLLCVNAGKNLSALTFQLTSLIATGKITAEDLLEIKEKDLPSQNFTACFEESTWSGIATTLIELGHMKPLEQIIENPVTTNATPAIKSMVLLCTADAALLFKNWEYFNKAIKLCDKAEETAESNPHIQKQVREIRGKIFEHLPFYKEMPGYQKIFKRILNKLKTN